MDMKEYLRQWRIKNREKIRKYRLENAGKRKAQLNEWRASNREYVRQKANKWASENRESIRKRHREWSAKHPNVKKRYEYNHSPKQYARLQLYKAIRNKQIIRPTSCQHCQKSCHPHGHHADYSKPLEVIWLCVKCHAHEHRKVS